MTEPSRAGEAGGWPNLGAPLMDGWLRMSQAWMDAAGRCGARLIAFAGARLEADLEHGRRLAECRDLAALGEAQGAWLRRAAEDYRRELEALSKEIWAGLEAVREEAGPARPMAAGGEAEAPRSRERRAA